MVLLVINRSDSQCGACHRSCLPHEESHSTPCGYDKHPGCGAVYTHVTSGYADEYSIRATQAMRPDLVFLDPREMIFL